MSRVSLPLYTVLYKNVEGGEIENPAEREQGKKK
jgi:hypothetical protein